MKSYPSISNRPVKGVECYVFGKEDGSNLRLEWNVKKGFHRWGRRNGLLDDSNPILKRGPQIFETQKMGDLLGPILKAQKYQDVTLYFEFHGPNSFAGCHDENEQQVLTLFDIDVKNKGMLPPHDFHKLFGSLYFSQKLLYVGNWTEELAQRIWDGKLEGMPFEGVVAKTKPENPRKPSLMWKFKSEAWLQRLRVKCGDNQKLFEMLV